jgi:hypothetical protein
MPSSSLNTFSRSNSLGNNKQRSHSAPAKINSQSQFYFQGVDPQKIIAEAEWLIKQGKHQEAINFLEHHKGNIDWQ